MGLSQSNLANKPQDSSKNFVNQYDCVQDLSPKSKSHLELPPKPDSLIKKPPFVRVQPINSANFKHQEDSLFFELLLDRCCHLVKNHQAFFGVKMTKSNTCKKIEPKTNSCTSTVRDGIRARNALKFFRLRQVEKKTLSASKSVQEQSNGTSGDVRKAVGEKTNFPTKNKSAQIYKPVKFFKGTLKNPPFNEYLHQQQVMKKELKIHDKKLMKENDVKIRKIKITKALIQEMSGDTKRRLKPAKPKSGYKLEKSQNSRNIPNEIVIKKKKSGVEAEKPNTIANTVERALKKMKLAYAKVSTEMCMTSDITDVRELIRKPSETQLRTPRSLMNTVSESDVTESVASEEKTAKTSSSLDAIRQNNIKIFDEIERTHLEQFRLQTAIEEALKRPCKAINDSIKENQAINLEISTNQSTLEISSSQVNASHLAISPSATAKACIKYNRKVQQALAILNNEVSLALRESFCSIDDIKFRVFSTLEKIDAADKLYQRLKAQPQLATQSVPHLPEPLNSAVSESNRNELLHALSVGLVQTQSENQVRLAVLEENDEASLRCMHEIDESPLKMPPLEYPVVNAEAKSNLINQPILPKIVPVVEAIDHPCTALKQQKLDIFNIPPCIPLNLEQTQPPTNRRQHAVSKHPPSPLTKVCKYTNRDLSPEIKLRLKEIAVRLGLDELPRSKAQMDLYHKLIKEFVATDSLIEFQRQMKHAHKMKINEMPPEETKEPTETKTVDQNKGRFSIMAEELYVPDRKINKIPETKLNASRTQLRTPTRLKPRFCQFLYREKKKKRSRQQAKRCKRENDHNSSNTIELSTKVSSKSNKVNEEKQRKYADSLWFCCSQSNKRVKKSLKQSAMVTNSDEILKCDSTKSISTTDNAVQTQMYDNTTNQAYHNQFNMQAVTCKSGLDCFDILDEISLKDLKPLESEYPRKDHIGTEPHYKPAENSYLYKLVYGSTQEQFLQLLSTQEPSLECTAAGCQTCGQNHTLEEEKSINLLKKQSLTTKKTSKIPKRRSFSLNSRQEEAKNIKPAPKTKQKKAKNPDVAKRLLPYMFDPKMRYPTTITVMPVTVTTYTNPNFAHRNKQAKGQGGDFSSATHNSFDGRDKYKTSRPSKQDRKLWETKYAKSPSINLISYLEKQNSEGPKQMFGDISQNFIPNPKSAFIAPVKGKKSAPVQPPPMFQAHTLKTHSQPHAAPKTNVKHVEKPLIKLNPLPESSRKPATLENELQNVIEMIEGKIIDLVSSPEKLHGEAFSTVEKEIVDILKAMQSDEVKPLEAINEDAKKENLTLQRKTIKKSKLHAKTSADLQKPVTGAKLLPGNMGSDTKREIASCIDLDQKSSEEEYFEITSACAPPQTSKRGIANANTQASEKIDEHNQIISETVVQKIDAEEQTTDKEPINQEVNVSESKQAEIKENCAEEKVLKSNKNETCNYKNFSEQQNIPKFAETIPEVTKVESKSQEMSQISENLEQRQVGECNSSKKLPEAVIDVYKIEENLKQQETTLIPYEQPPVEIKSDLFLTPFMHALKQYREEEHKSSYNILEFLDTLTNISEDQTSMLPASITGCQLSTVHYKRNIEVAYLTHEPQVFYPVFIWHPVALYQGTCHNLKPAGNLFSSINFNKILGYAPPDNLQKYDCKAQIVCCNTPDLLPPMLAPSACLKNAQLQPVVVKKKYCAEDHGLFLNTVYGMLFTVVFLSLSFNYTC